MVSDAGDISCARGADATVALLRAEHEGTEQAMRAQARAQVTDHALASLTTTTGSRRYHVLLFVRSHPLEDARYAVMCDGVSLMGSRP